MNKEQKILGNRIRSPPSGVGGLRIRSPPLGVGGLFSPPLGVGGLLLNKTTQL
jgi:hypothetical protein